MLKRLCAAILLVFSVPAFAIQATGPERHFTGADLFSLEVAADPQISPDGSQVAYVRRSGDIMTDQFRSTIWLVDTRSSEQTPIAAGPGGHFSPRWSPDGSRLAYISSAEGGTTQIFVRWMESGEAVRLTNLPYAPGSIAWSPDGTRIAYSMLIPGESAGLGSAPDAPEGAEWADPLDVTTAVGYRADGQGYLRPGFNQIFVVPADGGTARQLSFGDYHHGGPLSWTPDGRAILFSGDLTPDWEMDPVEGEIYSLDVTTSAITPLTDRNGPDVNPVVSPDGRHIAWLGFDDQRRGYENVLLHVSDSDGSNQRVLTGALDRSINTAIWSANSRAVYVSYDDHGQTKVARVSLSGSITTVAEGLNGASLDRPYSGGSFSVARDGTLAITSGPATSPADIVLVRGSNRRQLTHLNDDLLGHKVMGEVRRMETASTFDGRPIESWLTLPPGHVEGQRHPLILEIHGGPFAAYGPHFSTDNQLYAAAGYAVLSVNPRGSTSYGTEFANLIHHAYPGNDYHDLMSAVDGVIAAGFADPDQLFVTGGSGGGVLTSWIVGNTNRFRAAATQKPVINWTTQALISDIPVFVANYWFGALPWEDQQSYWSRSPLSLVGNVETPTLVLVGGEDERTPVSEAEQYYMALRMEGVPTTLIRVPGASHGGLAARPSQSAAKASAILAWFDRYRNAPNDIME